METTEETQLHSRLTMAGNLLIGLGVGVWAMYAVVRWGLGGAPEIGRYLPFHLAGVIPGALLKHRHHLGRLIGR